MLCDQHRLQVSNYNLNEAGMPDTISSYGHPTPSARVNISVVVGVFRLVYGFFLLPTLCFSLHVSLLSLHLSLFFCSSPPFFTQFPVLRLEL